MNENKFLNPHQPQTLYSAVLLGYIQAVFNLLTLDGLLVLIAVALVAGSYGIANEKKWGYNLAVSAAVAQVVLLFATWGGTVFTSVGLLLNLLFDAALVALLLHPMSRDYQRIWFR